MIAVERDEEAVRVKIPLGDLTVEEVDRLAERLRVEAALKSSRLADDAAWRLSEEVKAAWWEENKHWILAKVDEGEAGRR